MSVMLAPDLPLCAIGDEKRLMQTILNISGNAVKFTKEGHITLLASVLKPDSLREFRTPDFDPAASDDHFYLKVQVTTIEICVNDFSCQGYELIFSP